MVRPKGGRSQPRHYYLKHTAEDKAIRYVLSKSKVRKPKVSKLSLMMSRLCQLMDEADSIFSKYK